MPSVPKAKKHLETALLLDPHCAEACMELASLSDTAEAAMMWYQRSMEACEKSLGKDQLFRLLSDFKLNPWKQVELHTWVKAKVNLAETLYRTGFYETAAHHFQELLEINPMDDLQLRPYLLICLLCENRIAEAEALHKDFSYDGSATWYYCRAFLRYRLEGAAKRSDRLLLRAFKRNLWVAVYLLGLEEMPEFKAKERKREQRDFPNVAPQQQPFREGSRQEAVECVKCIAPALYENRSIINWMWERLKEVAV